MVKLLSRRGGWNELNVGGIRGVEQCNVVGDLEHVAIQGDGRSGVRRGSRLAELRAPFPPPHRPILGINDGTSAAEATLHKDARRGV